ncbi:Exopolyphosphatase [Tulasnella sp. 332]|nr:Exopolyphosphatase [Tulasnella sp. 332]
MGYVRTDYERFGWDVIPCIYWLSSKRRFFISDASIIQRIAASRPDFPKPLEMFRVFEMFGQSVLTVAGADWSRHKKMTSPAFSESNLRYIWDQTIRIIENMFDSDWSSQGDQVVLEDVTKTMTEISMLVIMAGGFGQADNWIRDPKPVPGHLLTFRQALWDVSAELPLRALLPQWVWGSKADQDCLTVGGPAGRGWLGKRVQHLAVAYSELAKYMREMLIEELADSPSNKPRHERVSIFSNLVAAMDIDMESAGRGKSDLFGNMFTFLFAGFETTAHVAAYAFGLLGLDQEEQQLLYDHIESEYADAGKLNRALAVAYEALRLYPAAPSLQMISRNDTTFTVNAAMTEEDTKRDDSGRKEAKKTNVFIPAGSEVISDVAAVHHNPRYWKDPYSFKPERFLDPNWPKEAFLPFSTGSRMCMGRRFAEVEVTAIIALIIRKYKVSIDPVIFPDIAGETKLQRRERLLRFLKLLPTSNYLWKPTKPLSTNAYAMGALSEFLTQTKAEFLKDLQAKTTERWTVVMGNEAGDLDTIACSVAYSYLASRYHSQPTVALVQTPRTDLYLRPENLFAFTLAGLTLEHQELLCIDDIPTTVSSLSQVITKFALVDHNRLLPQFQGAGKVVGIIDHHADERQHLDAEIREIVNPVGSCASLVTRHFKDVWDDGVPPELATLLISAIYIDTGALKPDDKAVDIDIQSAEFLTPHSTFNPANSQGLVGEAPPPPPIDELFDDLSALKKDVSNFSTRDLLRRDYKEFIFGGLRTGLSTIPTGLDDRLRKDGVSTFWEALDHYVDERDLAVLGFLATFKAHTKPKHRREILMLLKEGKVSGDVEKRLFEGMEADTTLRLQPKPGVEVAEGTHARVWNQMNTEASRKYTAPLIRQLIEQDQDLGELQASKV